MATTVKTTFQFKRGKASKWQELNPILNAGEPGFEIDTGKLKIGNGVTPWNELVYCGGGVDIDLDNYVTEEELHNTYIPLTNDEILELCSEK